MIVLSIIVSFLFLIVMGLVYALYRLNLYLTKIEDKVGGVETLTENLKQTFRDVLIYDSFLLDNGKLKKTNMQKEKDLIVNGLQISEESNLEI